MKTTIKMTLVAMAVSVGAWATCMTTVVMGDYALENLQDVNITTATADNTTQNGVNAKSVKAYIDELLADGTIGSPTKSDNAGYVERTCDGQTVDYGVIVYGGVRWLDRNLGSPTVATSRYDSVAYGDYYQWGRKADGHQCINSLTTTTLATDSNASNIGGKFVKVTASPYDWITPQDATLWDATGAAVNEVCPTGFHVPSEAEWNSVGIANYNDAYNKIKLPRAGDRSRTTANLENQNEYGFYRSSETQKVLQIRDTSADFSSSLAANAHGMPIRCVENP